MPKPKRIFYVEQRGAKLRYGQKGGGLFATQAGAVERCSTMQQQGADAKVFYADIEWTELEDDS